jgi:hypothetical protein
MSFACSANLATEPFCPEGFWAIGSSFFGLKPWPGSALKGLLRGDKRGDGPPCGGHDRAATDPSSEPDGKTRWGLLVVSRLRAAFLAACVLGSLLPGCSRPKLPPVDFTVTPSVKQSSDPQATLKADQETCLEEARRKGIASVTRILLLRGKISKSDYIACMKNHGYEVAE